MKTKLNRKLKLKPLQFVYLIQLLEILKFFNIKRDFLFYENLMF